MKKLLLILLCLPMIGFGQVTIIPDANFEQALINLGYDTPPINGSVPTANINTVTSLDVSYESISDLTGIQDFTALTYLYCDHNQLTNLDVSNNTALTYLECQFQGSGSNLTLSSLDVSGATSLITLICWTNPLTSLNISNNTALTHLSCGESFNLTLLDVSNNTALTYLEITESQIPSLDVNNNTALTFLDCSQNHLTSLDVSNNMALIYLWCENNQLTSLDLRNGNNINMRHIKWSANDTLLGIVAVNNPNLFCIDVDDAIYSTANWTVANDNIDPQHYFSNNCSGTGIEEHTTNKELLKVTDLLGRETKNQPLFYIYDDGTVEKRITIE